MSSGRLKERQEELKPMDSDTLSLLRLLRNVCLGMGHLKMFYLDGKCHI